MIQSLSSQVSVMWKKSSIFFRRNALNFSLKIQDPKLSLNQTKSLTRNTSIAWTTLCHHQMKSKTFNIWLYSATNWFINKLWSQSQCLRFAYVRICFENFHFIICTTHLISRTVRFHETREKSLNFLFAAVFLA